MIFQKNYKKKIYIDKNNVSYILKFTSMSKINILFNMRTLIMPFTKCSEIFHPSKNKAFVSPSFVNGKGVRGCFVRPYGRRSFRIRPNRIEQISRSRLWGWQSATEYYSDVDDERVSPCRDFAHEFFRGLFLVISTLCSFYFVHGSRGGV